jgi:L-lactate dehydrogenase complex protein LldG
MMQKDRLVASDTHPISPQTSNVDVLARRFADRVGRLGVTVERFNTVDAVADLVTNLAMAVDEDVRRVVLAPGVERTYPLLRRHLEQRGVTLTAVDVDNPAATFGPAAVGVSEAMLGLAETGTYAVADTFADRLVRMLAHRHVVILDIDRLVPGLDEAGQWLAGRFTGAGGAEAAHYASFITGPSRTADIEMSLTVGAHGPAELRIILLDREAGPSEATSSSGGL